MNITHTYTGITIVSDVIDNQLITLKYIGFTDSEAKKDFIASVARMYKVLQ